jgi:hypothetical protein
MSYLVISISGVNAVNYGVNAIIIRNLILLKNAAKNWRQTYHQSNRFFEKRIDLAGARNGLCTTLDVGMKQYNHNLIREAKTFLKSRWLVFLMLHSQNIEH